MENRHRSGQAGFTLVELLVVITIVVVLAALLFVGGGRLIQMGHAATSVNNLKTIGTGMAILLEDGTPGLGKGRNHYPSYAGLDDDRDPYVWADLVGQALGFVEKRDGEYVWLQPYEDTVFQNPGYQTKFDNSSGQQFAKTSSYGYNYAALGQWSSPSFRTPSNNPKLGNPSIISITSPSRKVVVAESNGDGAVDHLVWPFWENAGVTDMYRGGGHYLFVDGHVARLNKEEVMNNLKKYFRTDL